MKKTLLYIPLLVIVCSLLFGCASETPTTTSTTSTGVTTTSTTTTSSVPVTTSTTSTGATTTTATTTTATTASPTSSINTGGTMTFLQVGRMGAFGYPIEYRGDVAVYGYPCFEGFWRVDSNGNPSPLLATSWDASPDWLSITFHLREGVKFHDGTDWNAQAAKYTLDKVKERADTGTDVWLSIDIVDDYTLHMSFSKFQATQLQIIGQVLYASPTSIENNGLDWAKYNPVGTGPFKFSKYERDISLDYVRNESYWGDQAYLDGLHFEFFSDLTTASTAFQSGVGHIILSASADPIIHTDLQNKGFKVTVVNQAINGLVPDSRYADSPFSNKKVRQAIEYAIDKEAICDSLGMGFWEPTYQFGREGWFGYNSALEKRTYDPEKAKQLLAEAGYPNGFSTKLNWSSASPAYQAAIQDYLSQVGIEAEINIVGRAKMVEALQQTGWDGEGLYIMAAGCWGNSSLWSLNFLWGTDWDQKSTQRPEGFNELLEKTLAATNISQRETLLKDLVKLVYDEAMVFPFYITGPTFTEREGVNGFDYYTTNIKFFWNPGKVWLSE